MFKYNTVLLTTGTVSYRSLELTCIIESLCPLSRNFMRIEYKLRVVLPFFLVPHFDNLPRTLGPPRLSSVLAYPPKGYLPPLKSLNEFQGQLHIYLIVDVLPGHSLFYFLFRKKLDCPLLLFPNADQLLPCLPGSPRFLTLDTIPSIVMLTGFPLLFAFEPTSAPSMDA